MRYWEERYKYFGPDRFALPMTLDGAMKDSVNSIRSGHRDGFPVLLPYLDDEGLSIVFNDWTNVPGPMGMEEVRHILHRISAKIGRPQLM